MTLDSSAQDFLIKSQRAFSQAELSTGVVDRCYAIAGHSVRLRFAGPALLPAITPALAHLEITDAVSTTDITFCLWDANTTGIYPPRPPFAATDYRRYGQRAILNDGAMALMHAPTAGMLFAYDSIARQGMFWVPDAESLSIYERAAPLQTLLYWALKPAGWQIVHAAAVGTNQGGVLLVGNSGAGKSTLALSSLEHPELRYLCDDKCLVRLEPIPEAFSVFNSGKLKADMLDQFPHFQPLIVGSDHHYKVGKSLAFLHPAYTEQMVTRFPIKALLIPRIAHQMQPTLTPTSAVEAFRVLGPSTVIWMSGAEAENYRFTAELTRNLPCYTLSLGIQPLQNVSIILDLLRTL